MYSILVFFLIIIVLSFFFQILFQLLPFILLAVLIFWVIGMIRNWWSRDDSKPNYSETTYHSTRSNTSSSEVIDVDYEEREVD